MNQMSVGSVPQSSRKKGSSAVRVKCINCGKSHQGPCKAPRVCFSCQHPGHFKKDCPRLKQLGGATVSVGSAAGSQLARRVHAMTLEVSHALTSAIRGMILNENVFAHTLFNTGATDSFISLDSLILGTMIKIPFDFSAFLSTKTCVTSLCRGSWL